MVSSSIADSGGWKRRWPFVPESTGRAHDAAMLREAFLAADAIYVPDTGASTAASMSPGVAPIGHRRTGFGQLRISRMARPPCANLRHPMRQGQSVAPSRPKSSAPQAWSSRDLCRKGYDLSTMYTAAVTPRAAHARRAGDLIGLLIAADQHGLRQRARFLSTGNEQRRAGLFGNCVRPVGGPSMPVQPPSTNRVLPLT